MSRAPKNIAISVRDRLVSRARDRRENAQLLMTRYVIERLLYRLGRSPHRNRFILKGAMLFSLWADAPYRATGDLDLLGAGENAPEKLISVFQEILAMDVEDDGILIRPETLRAEAARAEDEYAGVRIDFLAELAGARLPMHVDIGYGDAVTPAPVAIEYPSLLDQPMAQLLAYPPETVVAEKFQAMVALDMINTRLKDFYDLWAIAGTFTFDGATLARAIAATFERRQTALPGVTPAALTVAYAAEKQAQWAAFLNRTEIALAPEPFPDIQAQIERFVMPPVAAIVQDTAFTARWLPGGPWER
ncbi:nucleotidyl transferase AbiEii/AbiGii toxin family protein [Sphingopyxis sp.]|uniref:nucleotidyl transferase AbiEii/AbiGii toxin family protein n=1 Tax=Sphingopyxis sp. TaxID=1908224 RepID=UPI002DED628C|nr:nucleotidyl transferase AbiEii/AbiGii toxin family protein [Sphingopyxis sp.]